MESSTVGRKKYGRRVKRDTEVGENRGDHNNIL